MPREMTSSAHDLPSVPRDLESGVSVAPSRAKTVGRPQLGRLARHAVSAEWLVDPLAVSGVSPPMVGVFLRRSPRRVHEMLVGERGFSLIEVGRLPWQAELALGLRIVADAKARSVPVIDAVGESEGDGE